MDPDTNVEFFTQTAHTSHGKAPVVTAATLTLPPTPFAPATLARARISVLAGVHLALDAAADEFARLAGDDAARDEPRADLATMVAARGCWRTDVWIAEAVLRGARLPSRWSTGDGPSCVEIAAALRAVRTDSAAICDLLGPEWPQIVLVGRRLEVFGPIVQIAVLRAVASGPTETEMATAFVALSEVGARTRHARAAELLLDAVLGEWVMARVTTRYFRECLALALANADIVGGEGAGRLRGYETATAPWVGVLGGLGEQMSGLSSLPIDRRPV